MPIYEYSCEKCQKSFDVLVRNKDKDIPTQCPSCGSPKIQKALSGFAVGAASHASHGCGEACSSCPSATAMGGCASGSCPMAGV